MMRGLLLIIGALACYLGGVQSAAAQTNEYHWVEVCNRGDVDVRYVVLATRSNFIEGDKAKLSGWHTIRKGRCEYVSILNYRAVTLGFTHQNAHGALVNPVYIPEDATPANGNKFVPGTLCVPQSGSINRKGSLSFVLSGVSPPCASGTYPLQISFYSKPGNYVPKYIITPRASSALPPWPKDLNAKKPQADIKDDQPGVETTPSIGTSAENMQAGMRRTYYTKRCKDGLLSMTFQAHGVSADAGCACLGDRLIKEESADVLDALDRNLSARRFQLLGDSEPPKPKDLSVALNEVLGEPKTSAYLINCILAEK